MINWNEIETVMLDMDGTLLDLHFDNYFWQHFLPRVWSEHKRIELPIATAELNKMFQEAQGSLNWYCLDYWAEKLQLNIAMLKTEVKHKIAIRPNVINLLTKLRSHKKHILLITNAHPESLQLKLEQTGIGDYFDNVISSHTLHLAKENHGFWAKLEKLEPYDPHRTLLIDDSLSVLQRAEKEGIKYLYGIYQPDSRQDPMLIKEYPQIIDFEHIMPPHPIKESKRHQKPS
jgi:HAD superfamily hydrolase (TIGR01509 family)